MQVYFQIDQSYLQLDGVRLQIGTAVYRMIRQRLTHRDLLELAFADLPSNNAV